MFHGNMKKFKRMAIIGSTQKLQQKIVFILPELPNWFEMAKLRLFIHSYGFRLNKNYYMYNLDVKNLLQKDFPCVLEFMTLQIMSQHIQIASNFDNLDLLSARFWTNFISLTRFSTILLEHSFDYMFYDSKNLSIACNKQIL